MSLPLRSRILYASSSIGSEALGRSRSLWLVFYYAPPGDAGLHALLPSLLVGVLLALTTVMSSLNQLFVGWLSDRTVSRWGRRIPYVVAGAPLMAIFTVLLFTPPADGSTAKIAVYLFFTSSSRLSSAPSSAAPTRRCSRRSRARARSASRSRH